MPTVYDGVLGPCSQRSAHPESGYRCAEYHDRHGYHIEYELPPKFDHARHLKELQEAEIMRQLRDGPQRRLRRRKEQPCDQGFDCLKIHDTWGYHVTITTFENKDYSMTDYTMSIDEPAQSTVGEVFDLTGNLSEEDAAKVAEAFERIRPLDKDQKANLLDILQEDYYALRKQIQEAFSKARRKAAAEVLAQFPEPESQVDRFRIEAEELVKVQAKAFRKLLKRAKKEGVIIDDGLIGRYASVAPAERIKYLSVTQTYDWTERDKALAEARKPIDRAEQAALAEVDRIQHNANRQIRLASVSKDASEILGTLPKVEEITAKLDEAVGRAHEEIAAEKALAEAKPGRNFLGMRKG